MLDGRPVVGFQVYRAKGFDETRIAAQVQETLDALAATHPSLSFDLVTDNVEYTREQYNGTMEERKGGGEGKRGEGSVGRGGGRIMKKKKKEKKVRERTE